MGGESLKMRLRPTSNDQTSIKIKNYIMFALQLCRYPYTVPSHSNIILASQKM